MAKPKKKIESLQGKLLIATPFMKDSQYEKAVVYICAHNNEGAMGVLLNNIMEDITCSDLVDQLNIKDIIRTLPPIHFGGPLDSTRGLILHTSDYASKSTHHVKENIALTATVDILQDIISGNGPSKSLIALGYTGWDPGQLEEEIESNSWICTPADESIIFDSAPTNKWHQSTQTFGIDFIKYSTVVGHA